MEITAPDGRMTPVSMLLPPATLARLDEAAAADGRSRSNMARRLLEGALTAKRESAASAMAARGHS